MLYFNSFSKILEQRDEVYKQTAEYLQLKTVIETIKVILFHDHILPYTCIISLLQECNCHWWQIKQLVICSHFVHRKLFLISFKKEMKTIPNIKPNLRRSDLSKNTVYKERYEIWNKIDIMR